MYYRARINYKYKIKEQFEQKFYLAQDQLDFNP